MQARSQQRATPEVHLVAEVQSEESEAGLAIAPDWLIVKKGASNTALREGFGLHLANNVFLFPEEALYAYNKQLIGNRVSNANPKLTVFYEYMRNRGQFLTRSEDELVTEFNSDSNKRRRTDDSSSLSLQWPFVAYDVFASKESFRKRVNKTDTVLVYLSEKDINLAQLRSFAQ